MFLSKIKHFCFFFSVMALPHFEAIAGKGDLLLKGATIPARMSSAVCIPFSYQPHSLRVIGTSNMTQGFLQVSPARQVSSAYREKGPYPHQNRVAGGLIEPSECSMEEKDALPYVLVHDENGGTTITFGSKTILRQYLDDVTLTEKWEPVRNASRDRDTQEYFKDIKKYPLIEENARPFWNFILSMQGSKITRGELNKELQKIAQKAELYTKEEYTWKRLEIISFQRIAFENLFTFNKESLRSFLDSLKKED